MIQRAPNQSKQEKADALFNEIRTDAYERRTLALAEHDLPAWIQANDILDTHKDIKSVSWYFDLPGYENYSFAEFAEWEFGQKNSAEYTAEAERIKAMYRDLINITKDDLSDPAQAPILIKRFRKEEQPYTYNIMTILPAGSIHARAIRGSANDSQVISYMTTELSVPCMNHACDDLYKAYRARGASTVASGINGLIQVEEIMSLHTFLNQRGATLVEYQDPTDKIKLDTARYVMCGVLGLFSNVRSNVIPKNFLD